MSSLLVRFNVFNHESGDYQGPLSQWYDFFLKQGRWHGLALKEPLATYPPLYLYLVSLSTWLPLPRLYAIKLLSVIVDYVAAWFVWRLAWRREPNGRRAWVAVMVFLFLPTVVMNSALWAQCDIMYTTGFLASLFYLLEGRPNAALAAYGFSCALKPQAIFWCPLLAALLLSGRLPWKSLFAAGAVYVACALPAILAGKSLLHALWPLSQVNVSSGLTHNIANWYQWVDGRHETVWWWLGIVLTLAATAWLIWLSRVREGLAAPPFPPFAPVKVWLRIVRSAGFQSPVESRFSRIAPEGADGAARPSLPSEGRARHSVRAADLNESQWLVTLALFSVLFPPFLLPGMHDRYYFAADVLSLVYAFYVRGGWIPAIWMQVASGLSYLPFLFNWEPVPLDVVALFPLAAGVWVGGDLLGGIKNAKLKIKNGGQSAIQHAS